MLDTLNKYLTQTSLTLPEFMTMENNPVLLGPKGLIKKHEFVRVIIQCLYSLGYKNSASLLESESGISCKSSELVTLESQILNANWDECISTLNGIEDLEEETRASALFLISRLRILESLNHGDLSSALEILRKHISTLEVDIEKVNNLASSIIFVEEMELGEIDDNLSGNRQRKLLVELERLLPSSIIVPERRLEHLVEMAIVAQRDSCIYHNSDDALSLYEDHCCGRDQIPTETIQILNDHENEVWFVQFSNNGEYLASSSSDRTAIIWEVSVTGTVKLTHTLRSHEKPVSFVSWSPNDTMLLTCGNLEVLKLWDVETGKCKRTFATQSSVCSCAWFPDSTRLVCGTSEPDKSIYMWDLDGNELQAWKGARMPKVSDLAVTPDGEHMVSIFSENEIWIYNFLKKTERVIKEKHTITSLCISRESNHLIVNLNSQMIHMWDIAGIWEKPLMYTGHQQGKYVIRSCFGGLNNMFIASGSEDTQVYIWSRKSSKPIGVLPGHSMTVNCVTWNPTKRYMLASASDDQTIRIWGPTSIAQKEI